ncbi:MAG: DUF167 domain-containing protein [Acidobacteriaceae bacterium]
MPPQVPVRDTPQGTSFLVRVQPRAKRNAVQGVMGEALRIALTTPPVEGRANDALIAFLAELLRVPRSAVQLAAGEHNRNKRVVIVGRSAQQVQTSLEVLLHRTEVLPDK